VAALGEHTSEILRIACGYSQDKIDTLLREGVVVETHAG
jgi:hypothetical protein